MQHDLERALCSRTQSGFEAVLAALEAPHAAFQADPLPHMQLAHRTDDLPAMRDMAAALADGAARIVLLGTGGSSLGAQVLAQGHGWATPAGQTGGPQLVFADNLDGETYARLLAQDLTATRFFVVSKSGGTAETLMQLGGALLALQAAGLAASRHMAGIAGPGDTALQRLAAAHGFDLLVHDAAIGGRFSVLTNVGLLPAIWAGADPAAVRSGAAEVMAGLSGAVAGFDPARGAALQVAHMQAGRNVSVMMPYADRLDRLSFWYRQLWAESLGKQGHGSVPVNALGPVDQHSQVQLYLDGPDDKLFTFITHDTRGQGPGVPDSFAADAALAPLAGQAVGNLVDAEARGTMDVLAEAGRPLRHIALAAITDESLGGLLMHFQLETIYAAAALGIDAFDQPAVEAGKIRAKQYLADMAGAS